ncbi:MAG: glycosyl transferase family protein [Hahellaceae bacterium]|nr:glycosyl transferase family protein [Hahellaceae bacterium]
MTKTYQEHPFAEYVRILGKGKKGSRSLSEAEAFDAMSMILDNKVEDLQLGAFLMLIRVKEESPEELSGFVKAAKHKINAPENITVDLDWSSYAGKRRHLPWYLLSIVMLAHQGIRVFIHGASGHTAERLYTENALVDMGFSPCNNWQDAEQQLNRHHFAYMSLEHMLPRMNNMINMRPILGLRSPVHSLSRLLNPLNAPVVLQGIFHPPYAGLHQQAGALLGYPTLSVIKGEGGEIERNPDNSTTIYQSNNGVLDSEEWPAMFERRHVKAPELSVSHLLKTWSGEVEDEYGEAASIGTLALALKSLGRATSQEDALRQARHAWASRDKNYFNSLKR